MHSLNQVNKLVSCGRDPARSLPLWRGFLLIPLILVCFAFAPQTRAVFPPPDGGYPGFTTAEGHQALQIRSPAALQIQGLVGVRSSAPPLRASILALALERWSSPPVTAATVNTAVGTAAMLLNTLACETQLLERPHCSITTAPRARDHSTALSAPLRSTITTTGFSNNAVGDSALFRNKLALRIPLLVTKRSRIMTRLIPACQFQHGSWRFGAL